MATIVHSLKDSVNHLIAPLFDAVFDCTLEMLSTNFTDHPDIRTEFFKLLARGEDDAAAARAAAPVAAPAARADVSPAVVNHCMAGIPGERLPRLVDTVIWGFKHQERGVSEMG